MRSCRSPVTPPILYMTLAVLQLTVLTGCEESKQMAVEVNALKDQIRAIQEEESRTEDELKKATSSWAGISNNALLRRAGATVEQKRDTAMAEVTALKKKRDDLRAEIDSLTKSAASFRQKYL